MSVCGRGGDADLGNSHGGDAHVGLGGALDGANVLALETEEGRLEQDARVTLRQGARGGDRDLGANMCEGK